MTMPTAVFMRIDQKKIGFEIQVGGKPRGKGWIRLTAPQAKAHVESSIRREKDPVVAKAMWEAFYLGKTTPETRAALDAMQQLESAGAKKSVKGAAKKRRTRKRRNDWVHFVQGGAPGLGRRA